MSSQCKWETFSTLVTGKHNWKRKKAISTLDQGVGGGHWPYIQAIKGKRSWWWSLERNTDSLTPPHVMGHQTLPNSSNSSTDWTAKKKKINKNKKEKETLTCLGSYGTFYLIKNEAFCLFHGLLLLKENQWKLSFSILACPLNYFSCGQNYSSHRMQIIPCKLCFSMVNGFTRKCHARLPPVVLNPFRYTYFYKTLCPLNSSYRVSLILQCTLTLPHS